MCTFIIKISQLILFIPLLLMAQISIDLPSEITVSINGEKLQLTSGWRDSLLAEADKGYLKYEIISAYRFNSQIETRINIPQFFSLPQVYRQIIFYYAMLSDEKARVSERIQVYPFFAPISETALISCLYNSPGKYELTVDHWPTSAIPGPPSPEEKYLYNQLIESVMNEIPESGDIPEDIFEKVARENGIPPGRLREIYQNVKLWYMAE